MEISPLNITKRRPKAVPTECKICGALAIYSYFGVISCQSCKIFFRRNAKNGLEALKCKFDDHCEINVNNRHVCSYCRLEKCFTSGMETEMIRPTKPKTNKSTEMKDTMRTTSTTLVRSNQVEQFPTLNLLQSDQSTLNLDQWNLVSNLSHCYDEHSGLPIAERYMREQRCLPYKLRFKSSSIIEMIEMMLNGIQSLYNTNQDFLSLSIDDRSLLLHNTVAHITGLSANFILYKIGLIRQPTYYDAVEIMCHPDVVPVTKRIEGRLDFDMTTMKLFLTIVCFSTANYTVYSNIPPVNLSNIKQILKIQDTYIELAWQYLLYKYDFKRTVLIFSDLIRGIFSIYEIIVKVHDIQWCINTLNSIIQQTEQSFS